MSTAGGPAIVPRTEWGAKSPKKTPDSMKEPAKFVVIHHSAGAVAENSTACIGQIKGFQDYHMKDKDWNDIAYSFVVGEDGKAYEGRGWGVVGAHTKNYNSVAIGICFIGDFNTREPNAAAVSTAQQLIKMGVDHGHISATYTLKGHRDLGATDCPGDRLYELVKAWPRFAAGSATFQ
ncbi:peptidoglycan-recognition protein SC2-like [Babylonia areolata]|uniref:peptidoglycan-recognition protein SC2-like n=1 Tax=Babylonia areolata TaxID=304850 RepID=UPI003FD5F38A